MIELLKKIWYLFLAALVISIIIGVALFIMAFGAVIVGSSIVLFVLWLIAGLIRSSFESKDKG